MEWKKETVSGTELEKMQREYIEKALAMQKCAKIGGYSVMTGEELLAASEPCGCDDAAESAPDNDETSYAAEPEEMCEEAKEEAPLCEEVSGEGLKQASEILEEMSRQTEIMKKLVEEHDCFRGQEERSPEEECERSENEQLCE